MELAIDTASGALSVALIDGTTVVAEHHAVIGRGHAETIVDVVAQIVGTRGAGITGIVVGTGPGSFTGARIGIAAARAFGLGWGVPVAGVGSLALVAAGSFARDPAATIVVAVADAGSGHVYWQLFDRDGPLTAAASALASAIAPPPGATLAGTGPMPIAGHWPRSDVTHPRAADARWLPARARGAPEPVYLSRDLPGAGAAA
jgi:tRNA threonylcarbamoyl adenosine modification protein YeaZ